jgi:PAS domain S-box-containing protein
MKGWNGRLMSPLLAATEADAVQETLLGEAIEHAPVGALVLDETGRYLAANRTACKLTGYERRELLSLSPADLAVEPSSVPAQLHDMATGELECGSTCMRCKSGEVVTVDFRVGATRSGGLPYFVLVFWERQES